MKTFKILSTLFILLMIIPLFSQDTTNVILGEVSEAQSPVLKFTFIHYLLAFIAYLLNVAQKLYSVKKKGATLNLAYYIQRNWLDHVLSILSIVLLFLIGSDFLEGLKWAGVSEGTMNTLSNGTKLLAVVYGWANYSIIKVAIGLFKKKEKIK